MMKFNFSLDLEKTKICTVENLYVYGSYKQTTLL